MNAPILVSKEEILASVGANGTLSTKSLCGLIEERVAASRAAIYAEADRMVGWRVPRFAGPDVACDGPLYELAHGYSDAEGRPTWTHPRCGYSFTDHDREIPGDVIMVCPVCMGSDTRLALYRRIEKERALVAGLKADIAALKGVK